MATTTPQTFVVERMVVADIPEVVEIERQSFSLPWPPNAYKRELQDNRTAHYIVVRRLEPGQPSQAQQQPRQDEHKGIFGFFKSLSGTSALATRDGPPTIYGSVSYTHLTLPTILRV